MQKATILLSINDSLGGKCAEINGKKQPFEHARTLAEKIIDDWAGSRAANDDQVEMLRRALKQTKIIAVALNETTNAHFASAWSPDNIGGTAMTACQVFDKAKGGKVAKGHTFTVLMDSNEYSASGPATDSVRGSYHGESGLPMIGAGNHKDTRLVATPSFFRGRTLKLPGCTIYLGHSTPRNWRLTNPSPMIMKIPTVSTSLA